MAEWTTQPSTTERTSTTGNRCIDDRRTHDRRATTAALTTASPTAAPATAAATPRAGDVAASIGQRSVAPETEQGRTSRTCRPAGSMLTTTAATHAVRCSPPKIWLPSVESQRLPPLTACLAQIYVGFLRRQEENLVAVHPPAPDLADSQWFNTDSELNLANLRGEVVVIDRSGALQVPGQRADEVVRALPVRKWVQVVTLW